MATQSSQPLAFRWRRDMLNDESLPAAQKHVLQTLQAYMDNHTGKCNPSIATLARDTGYSDKWVGKQLKLAQKHGWIRISIKGKSAGQAWNQHEYMATYPHKAPEPYSHTSSNVRNMADKRDELHGQKYPNDVPTNSIFNSINNLTRNQNCEGRQQYQKLRSTMGKPTLIQK